MTPSTRLNPFERYLSLWVGLCVVAGVALGVLAPAMMDGLRRLEFDPESGAALTTVVGVLIEVPVMLSVCAVCNRTRHWFPPPQSACTS